MPKDWPVDAAGEGVGDIWFRMCLHRKDDMSVTAPLSPLSSRKSFIPNLEISR